MPAGLRLTAGGATTCVVTRAGAVKCWGFNFSGQLGLGDANHRGDEPGEMGAALPFLEQTRGRVVTVASTLGLRAVGHATAYCASKFGVVGFTRALAAETAGRIGVTLLVPGGMRTAFFDGREERYRPADDAQLNDPADVADAVVFALTRPDGCEVRELLIAPAHEGSWP